MDADGADKLSTEILLVYLAHNSVAQEDLPTLITRVREAMARDPAAASIALDGVEKVPHDGHPTPAVTADQSVFDEFLISLEDGKRYRSLRRHLMAKYGMTPDDYRRKWSLPSDYPMVAPSYARARSDIAKRIGLGSVPEPVDRAPRTRGKRA
jgi:predicted transcriptional regulator